MLAPKAQEALMFDRIKTLMTRWQDAKEIDALSERDLDDLGMTRDQVLAFSRMPADIADRVTHMAAIFGLSDADLRRNQQDYRDILSTCSTCRDRAKCSHLLGRGADAVASEASFCLNAEVFEARAAQPAA
jgi:uncharacterized protein YjiS (DUF1127 family)